LSAAPSPAATSALPFRFRPSPAVEAALSRLWRARAELFLALFCAAQAVAMTRYAVREILPGPPLANDQIVYLHEVYEAALIAARDGALAGLRTLVGGAPAAGIGLQLAAYGVTLVHGVGRLGPLLVNIALFALVPGLLCLILGRDKPFGLSLFLCGFWMSVQSMYGVMGGPFDFRLDFAAMALFAVACALVWRTEAFTRPGWCLLAALAMAALCVTRTIMAAHLGVMAAVMAAGMLLQPKLRRHFHRPGGVQPLAGMLVTGIALAAAVGPYLALQWGNIWNYYVVGHVIGPEKDIRADMAGIHGLLDALAFYPRELLHNQLGANAERLLVGILALAAALTAAGRLLGRRAPFAEVAPPVARPRAAWALLVIAAALAGPFVTLNADVQKSWIVANVFVIGVGGLALFAFMAAAAALPRLTGPAAAAGLTLAVGAGAFAVGLRYEALILAQPSVVTRHADDFAARDRMLDLIAATAAANRWATPNLFVDHIGDLDGLQMDLTHVERFGRELGVRRLLAQIFEVPEGELWPTLAAADFLILRARPLPVGGGYPFDLQMQRLNAELRAFARDRYRPLGAFRYFGTPLELYARVAGPG